MQCYRELRVITARPSLEDEAMAPHRLYGVRAAAEPANAAWWREAARAEMERAELPVLCGGTGMYFSSLVKGIADIPEPGEAARAEARRLLAELGPAAVHEKLEAGTRAKLKPGDSQRIARAYEVLLGTGKGLAWWQAQPAEELTGWRLRMILLDPPREVLREAIATRFEAMLAGGALEDDDADRRHPEIADRHHIVNRRPGEVIEQAVVRQHDQEKHSRREVNEPANAFGDFSDD